MATVHLVLVSIALACLLGAALEIKGQRVNLTAAGLFLWLISTLVGTGGR